MVCNLIIDVKLNTTTNSFTLHANKEHLQILKASYSLHEDSSKHTLNFVHGQDDHLTLTSQQDFPSGSIFSIHIDFTGRLPKDMSGFYSSKFVNKNKTPSLSTPFKVTENHLLSTMFAPIDARKTFPCFDVPNLKAAFKLKLLYPAVLSESLTFLANTPQEKTESIQNYQALPSFYQNQEAIPTSPFFLSVYSFYKEEKAQSDYKLNAVTFEESPPMSTYLFAFAIGPLEAYSEPEHPENPSVSVTAYTTPLMSQQSKFAVQVAEKALLFYAEFFRVPYPLPKLDLLGVPNYAAGAMENWGLVTFREVCLLVDESTTTQAKRHVAEVVSHEVGHMWFGNLVTMEWWDDVWLNEGFATFVQFEAASRILSDERFRDELLEQAQEAIEVDFLHCTEAIRQPILKDSEISQAFDSLRYNKGGVVIRMLSNWVGLERLGGALGVYLERFKYQNTDSDKLFETLEDALDMSRLSAMMTSFVKTPGVPGVSFSIDSGEFKKITLTQTNFKLIPEVSNNSEKNKNWTLPIFLKVLFKDGSSESSVVLFDEEKETLEVNFSKEVAAVILNEEEKGYYVSEYSEKDLTSLSQFISNFCETLELDRSTENSLIKIVFDSFLQHRKGGISFEALFNFLGLLKKTKNHRVINMLDKIMGYLSMFNSSFKLRFGSLFKNFTSFQNEVSLTMGDFSPDSFETVQVKSTKNSSSELEVDLEKEYASLFKSSVLKAHAFTLSKAEDKRALLEGLLRNSGRFKGEEITNIASGKCLEFSAEETDSLLKVDSTFRKVVFDLLAENSESLACLVNLFEKNLSSEIIREILSACASAPGKKKLRGALELSKDSRVKQQDKFILFVDSIKFNDDREEVLEWIYENKEFFLGLYKEGFLANRIVGAMAVFSSEECRKKVEELYKGNENVRNQLSRVLETIRINEEYRKIGR